MEFSKPGQNLKLGIVFKLLTNIADDVIKNIIIKGWITYRFSYTLLHNDTKNMTSPPPTICVICRFSKKSIVFQKKINVFRIKKANSIFAKLSNLYLIVLLVSFFSLLLWITAENRTKNYIFKLQNQAKHSTTSKQTAPDYSSATAIMLVIFLTERDFCIISEFIQQQT